MRVWGKAGSAILAVAMAGTSVSWAQGQTAPMSDAEINKEAETARSLYKATKLVEALPLYEDLHKRQPDSNVWREGLAICLLGAAVNGPPDELPAARDRAHKLLLDAKAAGDNSNLLQIMLEKMEAPVNSAPSGPVSPGMEAFQRAEKAFSSGDRPGALKAYEEAAAADPKLYEAPLYAGDTEFQQNHYAAADLWYEKAAAIDPNRETAYRYWGDCLMKAGDPKQAEDKFIDAVIAEPYSRATRVGLKQWADQTKATLSAPAIVLPARPMVDAKGNTNVTIDPSQIGNPTGPAILAYSIGSTVWRQGAFKKAYPTEAEYRHSLQEEAQSIRVAISTLKKVPSDSLDVTWKTLIALEKDGMLECWILLDHPDQGIARDYAAYRAEHRDLLHAYIAKYDVHPQ